MKKEIKRNPTVIRKYFQFIDSVQTIIARLPLSILVGILLMSLVLLLTLDNLLHNPLIDTTILLVTIALIGLSIAYIIAKYNTKDLPTDKEIDEWFQEDIRKITKLAQEKLDIEPEKLVTQPIVIYKPILWEVPGIPISDIMYAKGKDGLLRFSAWEIVILFLLENYLAAYHANLNFITGEILNENTEEFFYKDIVKVGTNYKEIPRLPTENEALSKFSLLKLPKEVTTFEIKVSSGDAISIYDITKFLDSKIVPTPSLDEAIKTIRTIVREKKSNTN